MANKDKDDILEYLEYSYTGARAMHDMEAQVRIARAMAAYNADPEMEIFTEEFNDLYYSMLFLATEQLT